MPRFRSSRPDAGLIPLPWSVPLAQWPSEHLVALPRGISRHVVRFIRVGDAVYAAKEVVEPLAMHEYRMLLGLKRSGAPAVEPLAVVSDRVGADGEPLLAVLVTRHLSFSLPYRSLFSRGVRQDTVERLIDALVVLLVRLHLEGFLWGDVSLSNVLFRRDAGEFSACLVDAETGERHKRLSDGQRAHDLMIARTNMFGEFCDLEAGRILDEALHPVEMVDSIEARYADLWRELTAPEEFGDDELDRIDHRIRRLNALGFDVEELDITTSREAHRVTIQPKVVDAGHHSRRLMRLTGMDTGEHQARRLLQDLDSFRRRTQQQHVDEAIVAHQWQEQHFEAVMNAVPPELRGKREPAQLFHEVLDHRWYTSQREDREVPIGEAARWYVAEVLQHVPDEALSSETVELLDHDRPEPEDPWETGVGQIDLRAAGVLDADRLRGN